MVNGFTSEILAERRFEATPPSDPSLPGDWYVLEQIKYTYRNGNEIVREERALSLVVKEHNGPVTHYVIDSILATIQGPDPKAADPKKAAGEFLDDLLRRLAQREVLFVPTDETQKQFHLKISSQ